MTRQEYQRLRELDELIAWNNKEDGGRDLTDEEHEEHKILFWRLMSGEEVED